MTDLTLPHFVIIGAQKAGSTFVHHCLREHPQVYMPLDETPFFEDPFYQRRDRAWLSRLLSGAAPDQRRGIKRPNFLGEPECPRAWPPTCPTPDLIAILRNRSSGRSRPTITRSSNGNIPRRPIDKGLPPLFDAAYRGRNPGPARIVDYGFYAEQIARYLESFPPRPRMLILIYDDLKHDRLGIVQQVYRFVGVDDAYVAPVVGRPPQSQSVLDSAHPADWRCATGGSSTTSTAGHWHEHEEPDAAERWRARQFASSTAGDDPAVQEPKPRLSPALAYRLYQLYAEDIARLEALLERDLSAWRVAPPGEAP